MPSPAAPSMSTAKAVMSRRGATVPFSVLAFTGAITWLACAALLTALAMHAETGHISRYDTRLMARILDYVPSALDPLFYVESWLGSSRHIAVVTVLFAAWLFLRRGYLEAALALGAFLPFIAAVVIKHIVQEVPPTATGHIPHYHGILTSNYSFPSGHVVGFAVLGGLAFAFADGLVTPRHLVLFIRGACVFGIASVGIARVYRIAHYPSDCLAGYLLGLLYLIPALLIWHALRSRRAS